MFSKIFGTQFPGNGCIYLEQSSRFIKPVFLDDNVIAKVEITSKNFVKADRILLSISANELFTSNSWNYWYILSQLQNGRGQKQLAIISLKKAVIIIENIRGDFSVQQLKSSFQGSKNMVYEFLIDLLVAQDNEKAISEAFYWNEKARSRTFLDNSSTPNWIFSFSVVSLFPAFFFPNLLASFNSPSKLGRRSRNPKRLKSLN